MFGDDYTGSDALDPDEAERYEREFEITMVHLQKAADASQAAREFLSAPLGRAIRKALQVSKTHAMRELSDNAMKANFMEYKHNYDVICGVEQVFAQIIVDGEQAIKQLEQMVTHNE